MSKKQFGERLDIRTAEKLMTQIRMNRREQFGIVNEYLDQLGCTIESYIRDYNTADESLCRLLDNKQMKVITEHFGEYMKCLTFPTEAFESYKNSENCKLEPELVDGYIESSAKSSVIFRTIFIANMLDSYYNK